MAAEIRSAGQQSQHDQIHFIDRHFAKIAMAVSTLVLLILRPLSLFFGIIFGFFTHYHFEPNAVVANGNTITSLHATLAIIAAISAILRLTPGCLAGGYIFESVAPIFSMSIGSSLFLAYRACCK